MRIVSLMNYSEASVQTQHLHLLSLFAFNFLHLISYGIIWCNRVKPRIPGAAKATKRTCVLLPIVYIPSVFTSRHLASLEVSR